MIYQFDSSMALDLSTWIFFKYDKRVYDICFPDTNIQNMFPVIMESVCYFCSHFALFANTLIVTSEILSYQNMYTTIGLQAFYQTNKKHWYTHIYHDRHNSDNVKSISVVVCDLYSLVMIYTLTGLLMKSVLTFTMWLNIFARLQC